MQHYILDGIAIGLGLYMLINDIKYYKNGPADKKNAAIWFKEGHLLGRAEQLVQFCPEHSPVIDEIIARCNKTKVFLNVQDLWD